MVVGAHARQIGSTFAGVLGGAATATPKSPAGGVGASIAKSFYGALGTVIFKPSVGVESQERYRIAFVDGHGHLMFVTELG